MKRAILIAPPNDFAHRVELARSSWPLAPTLGVVALGSYLKGHGVPVEIVDVAMDFGVALAPEAEPVLLGRVVEHLRQRVDDIAWVGFSQMSNAALGPALAEAIRDEMPAVPIVFGGYFPTTVARTLLRRHRAIDAVVCGDGEHAALAISRCIDEGRSFLSDETPNLAWLEGDALHSAPTRRVDPAELPIWDFTLLQNLSRYPMVGMMTSRGCPFRCSYCLERRMRSYLEHPPEWVARQLDHLEKVVKIPRVSIQDPIFGVNRSRTLEILKALRGRRFTYGTSTRADVLEPELLPSMREAGFEVLLLGLESASPSTLEHMGKLRGEAKARRYLAQAEEIIHGCFENDITPFVALMLGFPGDTDADYHATFEFLKRVRSDYDKLAREPGAGPGFCPTIFPTRVYEGTRLWEVVDGEFPGAVLEDVPFIGERIMQSPGPGVDDAALERCRFVFSALSTITPRAAERIEGWYWASFSLEAFAAAHPELTDAEGVTMLGEAFQRFPFPSANARG